MVTISYTVHTVIDMPSVAAPVLGVGAEAMGEDPFSSCPIVGVFVRVQDADLVLVQPIANSHFFAVATRGDVVAKTANFECRNWQRASRQL